MDQPKDYPDLSDVDSVVYATESQEEKTEERDWPDHTDKEWLHYQYNILKRSMADMADIADVDETTILHHMDKHGIERRTISEGQKLKKRPKKLQSESWLRKKYIEEGLSTSEIAQLVGCSGTGVHSALTDYGVPLRSPGKRKSEVYNNPEELFYQIHVKGETVQRVAEFFGVSRTTVNKAMQANGISPADACVIGTMRWVSEKSITVSDRESKPLINDSAMDLSWQDIADRGLNRNWVPYRDKEWLERQYIEKGVSANGICRICSELGCDVSFPTIARWLDKFGIERRGNVQARRRNSDLDKSDVASIREKYANAKITLDELAEEYSKARATIWKIVYGQTWSDVGGPIKGSDY